MYSNNNHQNNRIIDFGDFNFRNASAKGSDQSFVADVNLNGIYRISGNWQCRLGYNLIWVNRVALAPDQIDFTVDYEPWIVANCSGILCVDEVYQGDLALLLAVIDRHPQRRFPQQRHHDRRLRGDPNRRHPTSLTDGRLGSQTRCRCP